MVGACAGAPTAVLYDPAAMHAPEAVSIRAWHPPIEGVREVLHARFAEHAYPPHVHDTWTLFLVDDGAIRYDLHGTDHGADPSMVSILPPHVVHDGRPGAAGGYRKRVLYLETSLLGEHLVGPAVDRPVLADPSLRRRLDALHAALAHPDDVLEAETRLHAVAERIRDGLGEAPPADEGPARDRELAERLRVLLDADLFGSLSIADAAGAMGVGPTTAARAFRRAFGLPPHRYVLGRRLEAARARILDGMTLAEVAADVGFVDQAHLNRRFKAFLGTTPGRFRASRG
jgi:AraC-like DNA-binding protein